MTDVHFPYTPDRWMVPKFSLSILRNTLPGSDSVTCGCQLDDSSHRQSWNWDEVGEALVLDENLKGTLKSPNILKQLLKFEINFKTSMLTKV